MHTSPLFFTHFFDWWALFSGVMALPIRQGRAFAQSGKPNKKFGRHLATLKYNLLLSPFLVSHIYKHGDRQEIAQDITGITGLKIRIDSFMLDLHQRREEFAMAGKGRLKSLRTSGMRINEAQLDFISTDIRAISAHLPSYKEDLLPTQSRNQFSSSEIGPASSSPSEKHSEELKWIDINDFVELDEPPASRLPMDTKVMPLAFAPRFTYIRQNDYQGAFTQTMERTSHFGNEPTHYCIMSTQNDPDLVQRELAEKRLESLQSQLRDLRRRAEQQGAELRGELADKRDPRRHQLLRELFQMTNSKARFLEAHLGRSSTTSSSSRETPFQNLSQERASVSNTNPSEENSNARPQEDDVRFINLSRSFKNRFLIHNVRLKWNNALRDVILHYVHQVNQRRGFVYFMSRRAVKFIIDIVAEQQRARSGASSVLVNSPRPSHDFHTRDEQGNCSLEARIDGLLSDGKGQVDAHDPQNRFSIPGKAQESLSQTSSDFAERNSYHLRLIAPQIQLQSNKNATHVVLVTAKEMELRIVQIMDKDRISDDISGLVQRRFSLDTEGVQFFVASERYNRELLYQDTLELYGSSVESKWPPWAPLETNFDFEVAPAGWQRVVEKTSASLRYDKYNTLTEIQPRACQ